MVRVNRPIAHPRDPIPQHALMPSLERETETPDCFADNLKPVDYDILPQRVGAQRLQAFRFGRFDSGDRCQDIFEPLAVRPQIATA